MVNVQRATISFFFRKQLISKGQERLCLGSACTLSGLTGVIFPVVEQLCQHSKAAQWSHEHGGTDWLLGDPRVTRYLCNSMSLTNDITQNIVILNHLENSRCTRWYTTPSKLSSCLVTYTRYLLRFLLPEENLLFLLEQNFKSRNITLNFESLHEIPSNGNSIER